MKRASIVFALVFIVTVSIFSGCISQIEDENGIDENDIDIKDPTKPEETVSYLKARINISKPYDVSILNSSRQNVVIIRDSGIRMEAIVTTYSKTYDFDRTTKIPNITSEEDARRVIENLPDDVPLFLLAPKLEEGIWGTGTVHWNLYMQALALTYAEEDADYNLFGTAVLIMSDQKRNIAIDDSIYLRDGYEYWWMQGATEVLGANRAHGTGPYVSLYTSMMRSMVVPTKIVYGLFYDVERGGVWRPHAWNEIYFDGKWVPVDPQRELIGTLSRNYIALAEVVDMLELYDDFACYRSNFEGRGCKPFEIEIIETGTVLKSELNN